MDARWMLGLYVISLSLRSKRVTAMSLLAINSVYSAPELALKTTTCGFSLFRQWVWVIQWSKLFQSI